MNILILGGLFALGIVALLAVAGLARGEQRQQQTRAKGAEAHAPSPGQPQAADGPEAPAAAQSQKLTVPLDRTKTLLRRDEQSAGVLLNQHFHELADELRDLHQQAWDLDQRLGRLSDMVDQLERVQHGQSSVEEEQLAQ